MGGGVAATPFRSNLETSWGSFVLTNYGVFYCQNARNDNKTWLKKINFGDIFGEKLSNTYNVFYYIKNIQNSNRGGVEPTTFLLSPGFINQQSQQSDIILSNFLSHVYWI